MGGYSVFYQKDKEKEHGLEACVKAIQNTYRGELQKNVSPAVRVQAKPNSQKPKKPSRDARVRQAYAARRKAETRSNQGKNERLPSRLDPYSTHQNPKPETKPRTYTIPTSMKPSSHERLPLSLEPYSMRPQAEKDRMDNQSSLFTQSIGKTLQGSSLLLKDAVIQYVKDKEFTRQAYRDPYYADLLSQKSKIQTRLVGIEQGKKDLIWDNYKDREKAMKSRQWKRLEEEKTELVQRLDLVSRKLAPAEPDTPLDPNSSKGMQKMREAMKAGQAFVDTLETPSGKFLGKAALSIAQNAVVLPTAAINPGIPLVLMGAIATADKVYALSERGIPVSEALTRGFVSGGVEVLTEKIPLGMTLSLISKGGKPLLKSIIRQAGVEATEEGVSYFLNFLSDKINKDQASSFTLGEFLENIAIGGVSGMFFAGVGTGVHTFHHQSSRGSVKANAAGTPITQSGTTVPSQITGTQEVSTETVQMQAATPVAGHTTLPVSSQGAEEEASARYLHMEDANLPAVAPKSSGLPAVVSQTFFTGTQKVAPHGFGTEYGKKGAAAFAVFRRGEADLDAYAKRFDRYYKSGRIGLRFEQIPADPTAESPHLAKVAFDAGVRDAKDPVIPRGVQGSAGNQGSAFFPQRGVPTTIPHTAVSHVSPETLHALESQYGKKGAAAFAVFGRGEADLEAYARRFDRYYKSGRIGLSFDKIPADLIAESPHLAKVAFDAGVRDAKETTVKSFAGAGQMGYNGGTGKSVTEPQMDSFHALEDRYAEMEQGWKDARDRPSTDAKSSLKDPASQVTSYENGRVGSPLEGAGDVSIYRAVGPEEFYDLFDVKKFRPGTQSTEVKYFGRDFNETLKFADWTPDASAIIEVKIPQNVLDEIGNFTPLDSSIFHKGTVMIQPENLDIFNKNINGFYHVF